ncbi:MAG: TetR family transcriptional regulator [Oligoflexia bacterium]|nr:TetR family transcriptional regulator [Oligoflexia bacterium]
MEQSLVSREHQRKSAILESAETLFGEVGYRGTTLRAIAKKSRANGALVSYYFGSKEGLCSAVIEQKLEVLRPFHQCLAEMKKPKIQDLQKSVSSLLKHIKKEPNFHRLAQRALLEDSSFSKKISDDLIQPWIQEITRSIQNSSQKKLNKEQSKVKALALLALIGQFASYLCFFQESISISKNKESSIEVFETYIVEEFIPRLLD